MRFDLRRLLRSYLRTGPTSILDDANKLNSNLSYTTGLWLLLIFDMRGCNYLDRGQRRVRLKHLGHLVGSDFE